VIKAVQVDIRHLSIRLTSDNRLAFIAYEKIAPTHSYVH